MYVHVDSLSLFHSHNVYTVCIYHVHYNYRTQGIFGREKFWRTMQVEAIGEEKFGE